jgi:hypothetical protein
MLPVVVKVQADRKAPVDTVEVVEMFPTRAVGLRQQKESRGGANTTAPIKSQLTRVNFAD